MALRQVLVCDSVQMVEGKPRTCTSIAATTCRICERDYCAAHMGTWRIRAHVALSSNGANGGTNEYVLGALPFAPSVCTDCHSLIRNAMNKPEHTIRHVLTASEDAIIAAIKARLTEATLRDVPVEDEADE